MSTAKHSLIANAADMDRAGGGGRKLSASMEIRPGIAYTDDQEPDSCCIPCTTPLACGLSFFPLCWPFLPFGCVPVRTSAYCLDMAISASDSESLI